MSKLTVRHELFEDTDFRFRLHVNRDIPERERVMWVGVFEIPPYKKAPMANRLLQLSEVECVQITRRYVEICITKTSDPKREPEAMTRNVIQIVRNFIVSENEEPITEVEQLEATFTEHAPIELPAGGSLAYNRDVTHPDTPDDDHADDRDVEFDDEDPFDDELGGGTAI